MAHFDKLEFSDFVCAHGYGEPNAAGYNLGEYLIKTGDDYSTAAAEIVARGLTDNKIDDE